MLKFLLTPQEAATIAILLENVQDDKNYAEGSVAKTAIVKFLKQEQRHATTRHFYATLANKG